MLPLGPDRDSLEVVHGQVDRRQQPLAQLMRVKAVAPVKVSKIRRAIAGARALLVRNQAAFESRYGQDHTILGEYGADGGSKLDNNGERLKLSFGAGVAIRDLTYDLGNGWPDLGKGTSLVLLDDQALSDHASSASWGISSTADGTPGAADGGVDGSAVGTGDGLYVGCPAGSHDPHVPRHASCTKTPARL